MREEIIANINEPRQLEKLYRSNKQAFKREFNLLYNSLQDNATARVWFERLNYENDEISWGAKNDLKYIILASLIAGIVAKFPEIFSIDEDFFFPRNIAFIVFPLLTIYFWWKQKSTRKNLTISLTIVAISAIYINLLPDNKQSDTLILACIHLPLLLWAVLGFSFTGNDFKNPLTRLDFLRYNGNLVVMTTIILIAGGLMTGITLGLFSLIDVNIENWYFKYIVVWGLAASPLLATFLVQSNPQLVNHVSPIIAKIFTPLVLITLVVYLVVVVQVGKDPYNDRDFLLLFNLLLIGVMALILFSSIEQTGSSGKKSESYLLLALSTVTILINGIALSAILFRIAEWGFTPNRTAILGSNLLILTNLIITTRHLFNTIRNRNMIDSVGISIAAFIPIYAIWAFVVTFIFPLIFSFK